MSILNLLRHPLTSKISSIDDSNTYNVHREIILSKPFLLEIYKRFYGKIFSSFKTDNLKDLKIIEIGAGGFNSNQFESSIITTDISNTEHIKQVEDAQKMSFEDNSLDGVILIDVLHHIPKPGLFFEEVNRCLKKGGKLIMIEPYYSPWGSLVYKNLHHEPWYDIPSWDIPLTSGGRLSDANMLNPHNIFIRDINKFKSLYPKLKVYDIEKINFFYYLLSGGLSFRSLIPNFLGKLVFLFEALLKPCASLLAMHMVIRIEKD